MPVKNGKSSYGTTNYSRNRSSGKDYAKKLQEEANKRVVSSSKIHTPKKTVVRNPNFDKLSDAEKEQNAKYLNSDDPNVRALGISHLKETDTTGYSNLTSKRKLSRDEKLKQYQDAFKSSPYTPENKYLTTLNKKEELEIKKDVNPYTKRAEPVNPISYGSLESKRQQFGLNDSRRTPKSSDFTNLKSNVSKEYDNSLQGKITEYQGAFDTKWNTARSEHVAQYLKDNIAPFRHEIAKQQAIIDENQKQLDFYNSHEYRKDGTPKGVRMRKQQMSEKIKQAKSNITSIEKSVSDTGGKKFDEENKKSKDAEYEELQAILESERAGYQKEKEDMIVEEKENYEQRKTIFGTSNDTSAGTAGENTSYQKNSVYETLMKQYDTKQTREKEDYQKKLDKKREKEWDQIKSRAEDATTTEEKERYLAQEERRLDKVYGEEGELMTEFLEKLTTARTRKEEDMMNDKELNILKSTEKSRTKSDTASSLQNDEKVAFIRAFIDRDTGDPSTSVSRALKAYERASKMGDEGAVNEFELGEELDEKLRLYNENKDDPNGLSPDRAYEWLVSEDVPMGVASKMLEMRGIEKSLLDKLKYEKMKDLGFSDEDIAELKEKEQNKSASEMYLKGLMTPEQEELYLKRVLEKSLASGGDVEKGTYKLQNLAEEYATKYSREELIDGRVFEGYDDNGKEKYRSITGGAELIEQALIWQGVQEAKIKEEDVPKVIEETARIKNLPKEDRKSYIEEASKEEEGGFFDFIKDTFSNWFGSDEKDIKKDADSLLAKYFPEDQIENAKKVIQGESGGNAGVIRPEEKNPGGGKDIGYFQINTKWQKPLLDELGLTEEDLLDLETNILVASEIYHRNRGWGAWIHARKIGLDKTSYSPKKSKKEKVNFEDDFEKALTLINK